MRLLRAGARARSWLAAGVVGGGLLAGGAWYADSHAVAATSLLDGLTRRARAQEAPAAPQPTAAPKPSGAAATSSKRPTGQVTQITVEPASFTMQAADGTVTTYQVLDTTVFMAGRDRPYRFDLLKAGDTVIVRGGSQGAAQAGAPATGAGAITARGKPKPAPGAGMRTGDDGEPIARQVIVRPAGENRGGRNGRGPGVQNGGSDGAGQ